MDAFCSVSALYWFLMDDQWMKIIKKRSFFDIRADKHDKSMPTDQTCHSYSAGAISFPAEASPLLTIITLEQSMDFQGKFEEDIINRVLYKADFCRGFSPWLQGEVHGMLRSESTEAKM